MSLVSLDKGVMGITSEGSPPTSTESSRNSGKSGLSSPPRPGESTGKTSLDSKFYTKSSKLGSQHSSENKKVAQKQELGETGSGENLLEPIAEVDLSDAPEPVPSEYFFSQCVSLITYKSPAVVTVETAAAAKVFLETHYNELTSSELTPRSLRRRQLEAALYYEVSLSEPEKDEKRKAWAEDESDHLRETRVMKARAGKRRDMTASKYEVVKVLGKGSFGVVRLVREKTDKTYVLMKRTAIHLQEANMVFMK